jgi:Family of unknown function (DUF6266)
MYWLKYSTLVASFTAHKYTNKHMAKINLITGAARGSAGAYTYKKWNGTQVMSAKVAKGPRPFNPAQQLNQEKQGKLTKFLSLLYSALIVGFANFTAGTSAWAQAIKENAGTITGSLGATVINFPSIVVSKGNLDAMSGLSCTAGSGANGIVLDMVAPSNGVTSFLTDELNVMVYNASTNQPSYLPAVATRNDSESGVSVAVPGGSSGDLLHIYCFFASADGQSVSNSKYTTYQL